MTATAGYRSPLARAQARSTPTDEDLLAMRRAAWRKQGVVVLRPEDVEDDWVRQALINEATRLYGRRPETAGERAKRGRAEQLASSHIRSGPGARGGPRARPRGRDRRSPPDGRHPRQDASVGHDRPADARRREGLPGGLHPCEPRPAAGLADPARARHRARAGAERAPDRRPPRGAPGDRGPWAGSRAQPARASGTWSACSPASVSGRSARVGRDGRSIRRRPKGSWLPPSGCSRASTAMAKPGEPPEHHLEALDSVARKM